MKHKIIYEDKAYEVDDSKFYSEQNADFKALWASLEKSQGIEFQTSETDNTTITVYDRGGVSISIREEEKDGK